MTEKLPAIKIPKGGFITHADEARWMADTIAMRTAESLAKLGFPVADKSAGQLYDFCLICLESAGRREARELQDIFDLQRKADRRAIKMWQAAAPGRELTHPDRADMVVFLLEKLDALAAKGSAP